MKNKLFLSIVVLIVFSVIIIGCGTIQAADLSHQNWGTFGEVAKIPVKDFVSLGLIFTEVSFTVDNGMIDGKIFSYQDLCKQAENLGANAIINVTIDKKSEMVREGTKQMQKETWYGSALAIKYTDVIELIKEWGEGESTPPYNNPRQYNVSGRASYIR